MITTSARGCSPLARKSDGLILHDRVLEPDELDQLSRRVPVVTLANVATSTTTNVHSDNEAGMRSLARHLLADHGYRSLAYVAGLADSPDSVARGQTIAAEAAAAGATLLTGPQWQGNYYASGGARVMEQLIAAGTALPRAIACANDQTALGVMYALARRGIDVPGDVAVTGFDDIPMARHLRPQLTTVRQPIQEIGATAFDVLHSMISSGVPAERGRAAPHPADPPRKLRVPLPRAAHLAGEAGSMRARRRVRVAREGNEAAVRVTGRLSGRRPCA